MCGICGITSLDGTEELDRMRLSVGAMVKALAHRGPDGSWIAASGPAVFGVTRLAIRGVHDGKQPIVDHESGVMVLCNAEIDNHQELRKWLAARGRSVEQATDVAVLPALYLELGEAFVERLVGAFAIAVWDPRDSRLLLTRDRIGERYLFFEIANGVVRFASELVALTPDHVEPLTISRRALRQYLQFGYFEAPLTPFSEIQKVAPAEMVVIDAKGVNRRRYWRWSIAKTSKSKPSEETFDTIFRASVKRQSEVDVDFGAFLSGGLDSSLVAAVAKSLRPDRPLRGYTIRFREQSYDEGNVAERVAALLGIEFTSVLIEPQVFPSELAKLVRLVGEPVADQSWIPTTLLARRASEDVGLALVGEGADELFGGYPTYIGAQLGAYYERLPQRVKAALRQIVEKLPPSDKKVTISFLLKRFVQGWDLDAVARHRLWTANLPPALLERLGVKPEVSREFERSADDLLDTIQQVDLETSLAEGLLAAKDRGSMSCALELRCPYLDQAVVEFAAFLPSSERVRGVTTKVFLKRYALRYLPEWVVHRKKRGLSVPFGSWLRGPLYDWADSRLRSRLLERAGMNSTGAAELLQEHRHHAADHARALWTLLVLIEWLEWVSNPESGRGDISTSNHTRLAGVEV